MALIYASAVNKRINQHQTTQKSRKKSLEHHLAPNAQEQQQSSNIVHIRQRSNEDGRESVHTIEEALLQNVPGGGATSRDTLPQRKRSTSHHSTPCSCAPPSADSSTNDPETKTTMLKGHKRVQRSRTSCGELSRKTNGGIMRKSSHPAGMSVETASKQIPLSGRDVRRSSGKLRNEFDLNEAGASRSHSPIQYVHEHYSLLRRDSLSLDAEEWRMQMDLAIEEETGVTGDSGKPGAFQRMRRKFSKWRLSRADDKEDR